MNRLLCLVALSLAAAPAWAGPPARKTVLASGDVVKCTVRSIHGQKSKAPQIDPRLNHLRKKLASPQFAAYGSMRLLEAKDLDLPQNVVRKAKLPNNKLLELTFLEKLLRKQDNVRLRLRYTLIRPKRKEVQLGTVYNITDGGTIVQVDPGFKGGILVLAITCKSK